MNLFRRALKILLPLILVAMVAFFFRVPIIDEISYLTNEAIDTFSPCQNPIQYSLGSFDDRFEITKSEFLDAIDKAESIWEDAIDKDLFTYSETGKLKINLIYDYRQEATQRLKSLGIVIDDNKTAHDALEIKYNYFIAEYDKQKDGLALFVENYLSQKEIYDAEVRLWNSKGGAPLNVFERLNQEKDRLNSLVDQINLVQSGLKELGEDINILVNSLNQIAQKLNLNVKDYNFIGDKTKGEFEEGVYRRNASGEEIDIYQFDNNQKLVRVLAHELGHALGLEHTDDPNDIMYRLNEAGNEKINQNDLDQLKKKCKIE